MWSSSAFRDTCMRICAVFAWGLKIFTTKKARLVRETQSQFALMSSCASSSVVVELLTKLLPFKV